MHLLRQLASIATISVLGALSAVAAPDFNLPATGPGNEPERGLPVVQKIVPTGGERNINFFAALTPDCMSLGRVVVRTLNEPRHGSIRFESGTSYPLYAADNPRSNCNSQSVSGLKLFYTSEAHWTGEDRFRLLAIYPDGSAEELIFAVTSR